MKDQRFQTFDEFWPHYVREHSRRGTRRLHFIGTTTALACVAGATLLRKPSLLALAPLAGYGAAWIGHFFIEKNMPATFQHPLWSLRADFVMWTKILQGTMDAEVERASSRNGNERSGLGDAIDTSAVAPDAPRAAA